MIRVDVKDQYPINFSEYNNVIKLKETDKELTIGYTSETSKQIIKTLKNYHRSLSLNLKKIEQSELRSIINKQCSRKDESSSSNSNKEDLTRLANGAPIINLVNSIIFDGINLNASDIHIEAFQEEVILRYRVDGVLVESDKIDRALFQSISSRIKIMGNLNIMENRQPQDGRTQVSLAGEEIDIRISIVPLSMGESIVLRLFTNRENSSTLEELGYNGINLELLKKVTTLPYGLVLISGPTGSGKTTTLSRIINMLNDKDKKIITIEDPVETTIVGVNQITVNYDIGLTFSTILRRVLRQDPDIILIGEIRDKETAELVVRASLTGHLVLSTLHSNDSISAISRLKELGIEDYLIISVLKASFSQRLVRKICPKCSGIGCNDCLSTGYKGRTAVAEGFLIDKKLESIILEQNSPETIRKYLKIQKMKTLFEAGERLVAKGITTPQEIKRVIIK